MDDDEIYEMADHQEMLDQEMDSDVRDLALALLDDENGINEQAFVILSNILSDTGNRDIVNLVKATEGRFYLPEGVAETLKK